VCERCGNRGRCAAKELLTSFVEPFIPKKEGRRD
jgi:hypothetical protein